MICDAADSDYICLLWKSIEKESSFALDPGIFWLRRHPHIFAQEGGRLNGTRANCDSVELVAKQDVERTNRVQDEKHYRKVDRTGAPLSDKPTSWELLGKCGSKPSVRVARDSFRAVATSPERRVCEGRNRDVSINLRSRRLEAALGFQSQPANSHNFLIHKTPRLDVA